MDRVREWAALIGRPNIAYVVFVSLLVPFGMLMEAAGPQGPDSGGGIMAAIILWGVVSLIFFIANAGLLISAVARGRSAMKPLIACALPIVCVVLPLGNPSSRGESFFGRGSDLFDSRGSSRRPMTVTSGSEIKALFGLMGCKQFHPDKVRYGPLAHGHHGCLRRITNAS